MNYIENIIQFMAKPTHAKGNSCDVIAIHKNIIAPHPSCYACHLPLLGEGPLYPTLYYLFILFAWANISSDACTIFEFISYALWATIKLTISSTKSTFEPSK